MSNLPHFIQDQKGSMVQGRFAHRHRNWLEKKILSFLKNESLAVRYVYGYLRYVDKDSRGFAYPSQATIAKAVKVSSRHVIRCLARLEKIGLISRGKKGGHSYYIFTLPPNLKETKSPLEKNIEEITQEVKKLKEKALRHYWRGETEKKVISPCHTNNNIIINNNKEKETHQQKIKKFTSTKKEIKPSSPYLEKGEDWFSWIEDKKSITLNKKEIEEIKEIENRILSRRAQRFKGFPKTFLSSYVKEIALAYVLKRNRAINYTGSRCLLKEEMIL